MAVSVEPTRDPHPQPEVGFGASLTLGYAGQLDGPRGWSARLDDEIFPLFSASRAGPFFGFMPGLEIWRSGEDNWGFSLPLALVLGVRAQPVRITGGVGFDAILVDQVADDTGFGMYAPFALARLAIDFRGVEVGVDTRVGYRWQIGAPDHGRWQLGFFAGYTFAGPVSANRRAR